MSGAAGAIWSRREKMLEGTTEENLKAVERQMAVLHGLARDYQKEGKTKNEKAVLAYIHECNTLLSALRENNISILSALEKRRTSFPALSKISRSTAPDGAVFSQ